MSSNNNIMLGFDQKSSAGFMELLGLEDFNSSTTCSIFDILASEQQPLVAPLDNQTQMASFNLQDQSSEFLNNPTTPNSSSLSSVSSGAEQTKGVIHQQQDEELHQENTNPQLKPKKSSSQIKKKQKKREPRFAFMTKSEVDHLEDGYRWRKYGQKAVKNSPFPRSYYRCTNSSCNVKKRVERSFNDASIVVTTYEGQHTHQSPAMPRGFDAGVSPISCVSPFNSTAIHMNNLIFPYDEQQHYDNLALSSDCSHNMMVNSHPNAPANMDSTGAFGFGSAVEAMAFLRDNGLLQDIVPSILTTENQ